MEKRMLRAMETMVKELKGINKELKEMNETELTPIQESRQGELVYDQEEAAAFIKSKFEQDGMQEVTSGVIRQLLDADEEYMRTKGIIEE